jgi:hypothetical protein
MGCPQGLESFLCLPLRSALTADRHCSWRQAAQRLNTGAPTHLPPPPAPRSRAPPAAARGRRPPARRLPPQTPPSDRQTRAHATILKTECRETAWHATSAGQRSTAFGPSTPAMHRTGSERRGWRGEASAAAVKESQRIPVMPLCLGTALRLGPCGGRASTAAASKPSASATPPPLRSTELANGTSLHRRHPVIVH